MKLIGAIICCCVLSTRLFAQPAMQEEMTLLQDSVSDFTIDKLGYIYIIHQSGQLRKITLKGDSVAVFNQVRQNGKITHIDVSNPLRTLLYYKDFNTIQLLDRLLYVKGTLDLRKLQLYQVNAVGSSYDNNIWVYDELNATLYRIDESGKILLSNQLRDIIQTLPQPQVLTDQEMQVFLYDKDLGVFRFDYFGGYKGMIPLKGWTDFFVWKNTIYGRDQEKVYKYSLGSLQVQEQVLPAFMQHATKIYFLPEHVLMLKDHRLYIQPSN